jgi:hypothetical protein
MVGDEAAWPLLKGSAMSPRFWLSLSALPTLLLAACLDDELATNQEDVREGTAEAIGVLRFLNGPLADVATLDDAAGLDARAARNIVAHVRGADGALGTPDDNLLESLQELDGITQVGPATIEKLLVYVESIGGVPRLEIEGVRMTAAEAAAITRAANGATLAELDDAAGLDARAARGLVDTRPHADIQAVARVPYVGTAALEKLRVWAPGWTGEPPMVTCHPGVRAGMRACVERQVADGAGKDAAFETCRDAEALGPVFDAVCAGPLGAPFCGLELETFFTTHVPPCAHDLGYELVPLCVTNADCGAPERCWGTVNDESTRFGVCKDIRSVPGQGDPCSPTMACGPNLVCAGLIYWEQGICVGTWMTGTFVMDVPQLIPGNAGASSKTTAVVHGLATVPVDILVDLDVRGTDPRRLRIWLESSQGDRALVWDGATDGATIPPRIKPRPGIPGDDYVNGGWKLEVTTLGAGTPGTLHRWSVNIISQWD